MLEQVVSMFDNMDEMVQGMKKKFYEQRMQDFREKHGHYFEEMTAFVEGTEDKTAAAYAIADTFTETVFEKFQVKGKLSSGRQLDLNLFMTYYVFPALLLTKHEDAEKIAEVLCNQWNERFHTKIGYTTYESLYASFREKIFGIF